MLRGPLLLGLLATASALSLQGSSEGAGSSILKTVDAPAQVAGYTYVGQGHCRDANDRRGVRSNRVVHPAESFSPQNCAALCDAHLTCVGFTVETNHNACRWFSWRSDSEPSVYSPFYVAKVDPNQHNQCYQKVNPIAAANPVASMATATVVCNAFFNGNTNSKGCADLTSLGARAGGSEASWAGPKLQMTVYRWRNGTASSGISLEYWDLEKSDTSSFNCAATEWQTKCTHAFSKPMTQLSTDDWLPGDILLLEEPPANWAPAASSGKSGSAAKGDPHLMNIKGEAFDVMQTGNMKLLEIPRGSSPATLDLALHADIERLGMVSCGPTFITSASITGRWMGVPVEIRSGPIVNMGTKKHTFAIRVDGTAWLPHTEMKTTLELSKDATITAQSRMFLFQVRGLDIAVSQPKRPRVFLDIQVKGLGNLKTEIGGLLGIDDHSSVAALPSACEMSASSLSLAAMKEEDEALQWSARALL